MDANLQFWRTEGQSFFQRFLLWVDALDPLLLLKSSDEIRSSRFLLQNSLKTPSEPIQNDQTRQAFLLSLSSVQPDTGHITPVMCRPPAFLPISLPLVIISSVQLQGKQNFFYQFAFHTYTTLFTLLNGNHTAKAEGYSVSEKQIYLGLGAISYASFIGAFPLVFMNRYMSKNPLGQLVVKKLLHGPLLGLMSTFTVAVVRSPEFENGIEVMDRNGKVVGVSKKAGEKAVKETALSRAVLFGTTFFLPTVLMSFVERTKLAKTPRALSSVRMLLITSLLTGMLPASLSLYPQCGEIKRADLEPEIASSTEAEELFYNRGI
ncbi:sideroflexin-4 [Indicator indicator]|uniref:sideroflexin-4 n=1 Tax=Indicator indicator TaxID=1002788 RepID=UPI0023DF1DA6|nr:sideroflexin-4 [Indicator indicator]